MKNKIIFTSICFLLVVPGLVNGYNPTNEELRSSIFDYMGTQSKRQQTQDILDEQTRYNNQTLNSYYRQLDSIQAEGDFKLKQLQAEIDARERAEAWQKEKQLLDKQYQVINENQKLQQEIDRLKSEEYSKMIIEEALDESGRITTPSKLDKDFSWDAFLKEKQQKEKIKNKKTESLNKPVGRIQQKLLDDAQKEAQLIQNEPVAESNMNPTPKKNVIRNILNRFMGLFK